MIRQGSSYCLAKYKFVRVIILQQTQNYPGKN